MQLEELLQLATDLAVVTHSNHFVAHFVSSYDSLQQSGRSILPSIFRLLGLSLSNEPLDQLGFCPADQDHISNSLSNNPAPVKGLNLESSHRNLLLQQRLLESHLQLQSSQVSNPPVVQTD